MAPAPESSPEAARKVGAAAAATRNRLGIGQRIDAELVGRLQSPASRAVHCVAAASGLPRCSTPVGARRANQSAGARETRPDTSSTISAGSGNCAASAQIRRRSARDSGPQRHRANSARTARSVAGKSAPAGSHPGTAHRGRIRETLTERRRPRLLHRALRPAPSRLPCRHGHPRPGGGIPHTVPDAVREMNPEGKIPQAENHCPDRSHDYLHYTGL